MKKTLMSVVLLLVAVTTLLAAPPNMQEGKWEISMAVQVEGVPFPMPPMKFTQCYTKKDIEDNAKVVPTGSAKKDNCEVKDFQSVGDTATWTMSCKDGTKGTGEITYKGTSYTSTLKFVTKDNAKSTNKITARRIDDCN